MFHLLFKNIKKKKKDDSACHDFFFEKNILIVCLVKKGFNDLPLFQMIELLTLYLK